MKDYEIAEHFREAFEASGAFNGILCLNDQGTGILTRPCLIFAVASSPMNDSGTARTYTLTVHVETSVDRVDPENRDPAEVHAETVEHVEEMFFRPGPPTVIPSRAYLVSALAQLGGISFRGWSAQDSDPGLESEHFRDSVTIKGTLLIL